MNRLKLILTACSYVFGILTPLQAQQKVQAGLEKPCNPYAIASAFELTFEQRACYFGAKLIAPSGIARASFVSAFGQLRNVPRFNDDGFQQFGHRFVTFYAERTSRESAELIAGYLHHEDPRPHRSGETQFWPRTRNALLSVIETRNREGDATLAVAPIAGAFGQGWTGMAFYRMHDSVDDAFRRTGFAYGGYFASALYHEFHPDISNWAMRVLHGRRAD